MASEADIWRDAYSESHLDTHAFYLQDTYTRNRLTLNLGFRLDRQDDEAVAAPVPANPHFPQLMPAIDFPGADAGVVWTDFSPRVGMTYDLQGDGRSIVSASFATYYGQMAPGQLSNVLASTGAVLSAIRGLTPTGTASCSPPKSTPRPHRWLECGVQPGRPGQLPKFGACRSRRQERPHA